MRTGPTLATIYFLLVIVAQWNDPDPFVWTAAYAAVTMLSAAAAFDRYFLWPTVAALVGYTVGFLAMLPALAHFRFGAFATVGMSSMEDERVREAVGLLICVVWTAWLLRSTLRRQSA